MQIAMQGRQRPQKLQKVQEQREMKTALTMVGKVAAVHTLMLCQLLLGMVAGMQRASLQTSLWR